MLKPVVLHIEEDDASEYSERFESANEIHFSLRNRDVDLKISNLLSNDVRAWPIWNHVDLWTSPKSNWKIPNRARHLVSIGRTAAKVSGIRDPFESTIDVQNVHGFDPSSSVASSLLSNSTSSPIDELSDPSILDWNRKTEFWGNPQLGQAGGHKPANKAISLNTVLRPETNDFHFLPVAPVAAVAAVAPPRIYQGPPSQNVLVAQNGVHSRNHGQFVAPAGPRSIPEVRDDGFRTIDQLAQPTAAPLRLSKIRKRSLLYRSVRAFSILMLLMMIVGGTKVYNFVQTQSKALPELPENPASLLPESSVIYSSDGTELGHVFGERRKFVSLNQIAPVAIQALIAAEDHRFYDHDGVDFRRIVGAAWHTINGDPEGASTITMQLVRNYFPSAKQNNLAERKTREILMARRITSQFSKDETLELYLNTVAFGSNSFGIEAASKRFFPRLLQA